MPNPAYASEWLDVAAKNLETARLLFRENHFTDIIAIEVHQAVEKALKSILAYNGARVPKTHNLLELLKQCGPYITLEGINIDDLIEINDYYENTRYPGPRYAVPALSEIAKNLKVASDIFDHVSLTIKVRL